MASEDTGMILAIFTTDFSKVQGGGCPVFLASNEEEMGKLALLVARCTDGTVHDLENGIYFVLRH